ncbi:MAG: 2OG-Fe(II) oxygenase [Gammaproteobacteria bacterium]|nr:2OG-Fe(II) oxygenase [Gammaproteobacteria bacterium]
MHYIDLTAAHATALQIAQTVLRLIGQGEGQGSHFFGGRFENLYLPRQQIPGLERVLNRVQQHAARLLHCPATSLRLGYWFNVMHQGQVTLPHCHDDNNEVLSGTYYLQVPPSSGELRLSCVEKQHVVPPRVGRLVFFAPATVHEVTQHQHLQPRISLGFNLGVPNVRHD